MKKILFNLFFVVFLAGCSTSCKEEKVTPDTNTPENPQTPQNQVLDVADGFPEDFEGSTKTAYATGPVTLKSGTWILEDALIGNSESDRKTGNQSVRIRNTGKLTMDFASLTGAATVSISHAKYGTDADSEWELWVSNKGGAFTKVGNTVTAASTTLAIATFEVNLTGAVQFEIRKISGGTARINIDDFTFNGYGIPGGTTPTPTNPNQPAATDNTHLGMGNPSNATANVADFSNYLMQKTEYALSYNRDRGIPNWVSWHLDKSWLGTASRQDDFRPDITLPAGWYQVSQSSYTGSGFDRGHNCPSADRTNSTATNSATFLMTNMIPQAPNNNQKLWADLENFTRSRVLGGNEVYVIMGSYGSGGTGSKGGVTQTINNGKVTVPAQIWKVVVILPEGNNDVNRVGSSARVIAVNTPNQNSVGADWGTYRTSVDAIEAATGYNLLSNLPDSVQTRIEALVDNGPTR